MPDIHMFHNQSKEPCNSSFEALRLASMRSSKVWALFGAAPFARYASPASDATASTLRSVACRLRPPCSAAARGAMLGAGWTSSAAAFGGSCAGHHDHTPRVVDNRYETHNAGYRQHATPR